MIFRPVAFSLAAAALFFAGCSTSTPATFTPSPSSRSETLTSGASSPAGGDETPQSAGETAAPAVEPVAHKKPMSAPGLDGLREAEPKLKTGEYLLRVESDPPGATVVVNGQPCGKTPCDVIVKANGRGFLKERLSIKARFIATAEGGAESRTVEEVLTTLDRVRTEIRFTPAGASRIVR